MTDRSRPAWAHDSIALRLEGQASPEQFTPEVAFGGSTGKGVRVAVVDSGVDGDHPMLDGCVESADGIDFSVDADGEVVATPGPHGDNFGHGTAVAGIIHALAPQASITSVRVLGPNLSGKAAAFHAGLSWAVDEGFDIVNLSLGTTRSEWALAFHEVCDRAYFGNTFVVTAANNVQRASYPSLFASVASVACNTTTDPLRFHANPQPPTEFLARGIDIDVPWINGGMTTITGNSFAAPHIAGLAALIKANHPELRPFQLKAALWATSANVLEASPIEPAGRRTTMFVGGLSAANDNTVESDGPSGYRLRGAGSLTRWGTLWDGERLADGRSVSIHQLDPTERDPASASTELRSMIEKVKAVGHPGIAEVLEVVDRPWLGVVGERRRQIVREGDAVSVATALALVQQVCSVLSAAHHAGLLHGALASSSLASGEAGVLVHDLGLVAALGAPSPTAIAALDPKHLGHLAPELLEGKPATELCDVYSVGVLLHRLLRGCPPYADDVAVGRYLRQRLSVSPEPTCAAGSELPPELGALVDQCLALDPTLRPQSVTDLSEQLRRFVDGPENVREVEAIPPNLDLSQTPAPEDEGTDTGKIRRWGFSRRGGRSSEDD